MAAEDVALALIALDDADVRSSVRDGDLGALGDRAFSEEEREMVMAAAEDEPEVEGFDAKAALSANAFAYVSANQASLSVATHARFSDLLGLRFGGGVAVQVTCQRPSAPS